MKIVPWDETSCNFVCTAVSDKPTSSILLREGSRFPITAVSIYAPHSVTPHKTEIYIYYIRYYHPITVINSRLLWLSIDSIVNL
jgi:hypothetical protein